ncbi:permease, partial [Acinetobacter baumannii]
MALLLPVLAFIIGLLLAQTSIAETIKPILSAWLARLLIPIVIIYNMVFYGALGVVLGGRIGYVLFYEFDKFL